MTLLVAQVSHGQTTTMAKGSFDDVCDGEKDCVENGQCTLVDDDCRAATDNDCEGTLLCRVHGRCTAREGRCVAATVGDCQRATNCRTDGDCFLDRAAYACDDGHDMRSRPVLVAGATLAGADGLLAFLGLFFYLGGKAGGGTGEQTGPLMALAGGIGIAAAVPVMVVGGLPVPRDDGEDVQVHIGPAYTGVSVSF